MNLTVKDLRERIKDLPDEMLVGYQRVEDRYFSEHGWKSVRVVWEAWPGRDVEHTEWVSAFSAFVTVDDKGDKLFMIHAHY